MRRRERLPAGAYLHAFIVCVLFYFISDFLLENYHAGDRIYYSNFYEISKTIKLSVIDKKYVLEIFSFQREYTGSIEPLYGVVVWIFSKLLNNIDFLNLVNIALVGSLVLFLSSYRVPYWVIILALSNFYLIVLLTSAERLKFAFLMLFLASLASGKVMKGALLVSAPLFHLQTFILYVALFIGRQFAVRKNFFSKSAAYFRFTYVYLIYIIIILFIFLIYRDYIFTKLLYYVSFEGNLFGLLALAVASILTFKRIAHPSLAIASLGVVSLIIGDERVNMIGYIAYAYYCVTLYKTNNIYYLALGVYFSYKSIGYVHRIIEFGSGF